MRKKTTFIELSTFFWQLYNQQQEIHRMYERLQGPASSVTGSIAGSERVEHVNLNNNRTAYRDYSPPFSSMPGNAGSQFGQTSGV